MAEYIKRKNLVDLVLSKLKYLGDARIMNQNDEKVLSEIDGYEKAMKAVHELILNNDLIENIQPVKHGRWICEFYNDVFDVYQADCSVCKRESTDKYDKISESYEYCPHCGARMDLEDGDTNG